MIGGDLLFGMEKRSLRISSSGRTANCPAALLKTCSEHFVRYTVFSDGISYHILLTSAIFSHTIIPTEDTFWNHQYQRKRKQEEGVSIFSFTNYLLIMSAKPFVYHFIFLPEFLQLTRRRLVYKV